MNSQEKKASKRAHLATAARWERRAGEFATRADAVGRKVRAAEKEPIGAARRARKLATLARAVASLLGSFGRCERLADRHTAAAARLEGGAA